MGADRRVDQWLELVATLLATPLDDFPERQLAVTFEARGVAFSRGSPAGGVAQRLWPADEQFHGRRADVETWSAREAATGHPVMRFYLSTYRPIPMQVCDVPDTFADRRVQEAWFARSSEWGVPSHVAVPLHFTPLGHSAFVIGRADPFTADELTLVGTLQRLLIGLARQTAALQGVARAPSAVEVASDVRLTVRELAVLGLVAQGLTAASVGRRLGIAEATVHKHLQRVYGKLDVRDRLAAVLRAQHLGLLARTTERPL